MLDTSHPLFIILFKLRYFFGRCTLLTYISRLCIVVRKLWYRQWWCHPNYAFLEIMVLDVTLFCAHTCMHIYIDTHKQSLDILLFFFLYNFWHISYLCWYLFLVHVHGTWHFYREVVPNVVHNTIKTLCMSHQCP